MWAPSKAAKRHSDYLIDRAMQLFPSRTAEGKSKALNYLMPHIRRMPNPIVRDEFASDAAQKLGIDSALVREELRQAARKRRDGGPPVRRGRSERRREGVVAGSGCCSRKPPLPPCFPCLARPAPIV